MRKILIYVFLSIVFNNSYSQDQNLNDKLIELGKIYRNFMFRNSPPEGTNEKLDMLKSDELNFTVDFIRQTITFNNNLTSEYYLKLPDTASLKYIYTVKQVNINTRQEYPKDNNLLVDSILSSEIKYYALMDNYYDMLFSGVGNKNKPFDLANVNLELEKYNLSGETEKGIFFLKAMTLCGLTIWGYMNIVDPPNYKASMEKINKYPSFNGQPYYQYLDLNFPDFKMIILKDEGEMSYKEYYIDKYLATLIYHYRCLSRKKKYKEQRYNLVLGSILKEEHYYKYSKKYKADLESLFTTLE